MQKPVAFLASMLMLPSIFALPQTSRDAANIACNYCEQYAPQTPVDIAAKKASGNYVRQPFWPIKEDVMEILVSFSILIRMTKTSSNIKSS